MAERTMNGIPLNEIWERLSAEFPQEYIHPTIYPRDSDRPTSVANALDSAVQDVFKRCAKRFGIAKKEKNSAHTTSSRGKNQTEKLMNVTFLEAFRALPKGGVKSKVTYGEKTLEMVIWSKE